MRLSPAEYVISQFKGVRKTARAIGRSPGSVSKWQKADRDGIIGGIPSGAQHAILDAAKKLKLNITADHLINGYKPKK